MWIRHSNGQELLVVNEDHIKRLLNEGGVEIPDPTKKQTEGQSEKPQSEIEDKPESEQSDGSTLNNDSVDQQNKDDDRRSGRRKSKV